jgi:multicomponent Na+:H+ antiporter subunit G
MIATIISLLLIAIGILAMCSGLMGLMRYRSFFNQMHAMGLHDTAGVMLILLGLVVHAGFSLLSLKLLLLLGILLVTSPTVTHLLASLRVRHEKMQDKEGTHGH